MPCFVVSKNFQCGRCDDGNEDECRLCFLFNICSFVGNPIFCVDIHPDGSRFATGGQGRFQFLVVKTGTDCLNLILLS